MFSRAINRSCFSLTSKVSQRNGRALALSRLVSSIAPEEKKVVETDENPNILYCGLYSTLCYAGVYVGTLATVYIALSHGVISTETFDIDQVESAAKMQDIVGTAVNFEEGPQFQQLADAAMMNRYLKVPRVIMTTGVALVMAKTCGIDMNKDEDAHKKIFVSLFALSFLEMDV